VLSGAGQRGGGVVERRDSRCLMKVAASRGRVVLVAAGVALAVGAGLSFGAQHHGSAPSQDSTRAFIVDQDPCDNLAV
jgi:hypothetical protein